VWQEAATQGVRRADERIVAAALDHAVAVEDTLAGGKLATLTPPQLQVLAALARDPTPSPTAAPYLARHRLPPKSTVSQALRSLAGKGDVEHDKDLFLVADPMLGEWLRRQYR
jgi:DNA-binding MarR family transcriptional regulator